MNEGKKVITKNPQETRELAKMLISEWLKINKRKSSNWLLCLSGELGGGKTTFTQALARELGIKGVIGSPTFLIMKKYQPAKKINKKYTLYHFDCYRLNSGQEVLDLGWEEIIKGENNIIVVEWPEKIEDVLPKKRLNIKFKMISEKTREIILS
jgi:tRNA threonylcarbamoyladenosine biosynthesis protein TsaE